MAGYDPSQAFVNPGRFVLGPSQPGLSTGSYPFSGTPLGICSRARFHEGSTHAYGASEALSRDKASLYSGKHWASLAFVLVQYDPVVLNQLYASSSVSAGGYQGANVLSLPLPGRNRAPGKVNPATLLGVPVSLLFAADDLLDRPSLIAYAPGFKKPDPELVRSLALDEPFETAVEVVFLLDSAQRDYQCDLIGNLSI